MMSISEAPRLSRKRKAEDFNGAAEGDFCDGYLRTASPLHKRLKSVVTTVVNPFKFLSTWLTQYQSRPIGSACSIPSYASTNVQQSELLEPQRARVQQPQHIGSVSSNSDNSKYSDYPDTNGVQMNFNDTNHQRQRCWADGHLGKLLKNSVSTNGDREHANANANYTRTKLTNGFDESTTRKPMPTVGGSLSNNWSRNTINTNGSQSSGPPVNSTSRSGTFRAPMPISTLVTVGAARYNALRSRVSVNVNNHQEHESVASSNRSRPGVNNLLHSLAAARSSEYGSWDRSALRPDGGKNYSTANNSASHSSAASVVTNMNPFRPDERDKYRELLKQWTSATVPLAHDAFVPQRDVNSASSSIRRMPRYSFEASGGFAAQLSSTRVDWSRRSSISTQVISSGASSPNRERDNESTLRSTDERPVENAVRSKLLSSQYADEAWLASISLRETERNTLQRQIERERENQADSRRAREVFKAAYAGELRRHTKAFDEEEAHEFAERFEKVSMFLKEQPSLEEYEKLLLPPAPAEEPKRESESETPSVDEFIELPDDAEQLIKRAFRGGAPDETLVDGFRLQLKRADISTLAGLNWLNDEVINFYMQMIADRSERANSTDQHRRLPKVYSFNTFFYPKLISGGHAALKRWTKKVDLFDYDLIIVPVHMQVHWCLAVIDFRSKVIRYYDSMGGPNQKALRALLDYLDAEHRDKKGAPFNTSDWQLEHADVPQQENGSDCGMFACKFADFASRDAPIVFTQEHMPYYRKRMVYELLNKRFLDGS